ncbi:sulfotransferase family protein [Acidocella sp.]|jgi:hypothetical protein|uniref:sulfotransferase family protein n=1 Tax=Acidocella sp. TaxID=50710 RepID=UPI002F42A770
MGDEVPSDLAGQTTDDANRQSIGFRTAFAAMEVGARLGVLRSPGSLDTRALGPAPSTEAGRTGLRQLLDALDHESRLTGFGKLSVSWDLKRLLRNAAYAERVAAEAASAGTDQIEAPLFILGLPRSGTTFLHALLAADPDNLVPRVWQTIEPVPRPVDFNPRQDKAVRAVNRQLRMFAGFTPEFSAMHPIDADSPQECSEITAHVFQSLRFDTTFRVPSYLNWLERHGHDDAFAFHRKFLICLQQGLAARRWVLKCPDHTFSLPEILRAYPDARFVIVHRDPIRVFASVAHLTEVLRRPFLHDIDPVEIGRQVVERWIEGAHRLVAFDREASVPESRKINLRYEDLTADPLGTIRRVYGHFDIPFSAAAQQAIRGEIEAKPRGGYPEHQRYMLGRFGIQMDMLTDGFRPYLDHFGIALAG